MPQFVVLMAEDDHAARWDGASEDEQQRVFDAFAAFTRAVRAEGAFQGGRALMPTVTARTRVPGGAEFGPGTFAPGEPQFHGIWLIEMADLDAALRAAALLPAEYVVEVRQCLDVDIPNA